MTQPGRWTIPTLTLGLLMLMLAAPGTAAGQSAAPPQGLMAKGGVTFSTLVYSDAGDFFDPAIGFAGGISHSLLRFEGWRTQVIVEGLYIRKGGSDAIIGDRLALDWIEVPVLARIDIRNTGRASFFGVVGPAFDFLLRADFGGEDAKDVWESVGIGLVAGGGMAWDRWSVEGRMTFGFTNLPKVFGSETLRDRTVVLLAGYRLK